MKKKKAGPVCPECSTNLAPSVHADNAWCRMCRRWWTGAQIKMGR